MIFPDLMLIISSYQFQKIQAIIQNQFIVKVLEILKNDYSGSASEDELRLRIEHSLEPCDRLNITGEKEVALYVKATFLFGIGFLENNEIANALFNHPKISQEIKLEWLKKWCNDQSIEW